MKSKSVPTALLAILALFLLTSMILANNTDDYRVIKRAVDQGPAAGTTAQPKPLWLKIVVNEGKDKGETVKITLPLSFVETILRHCDEDKSFNLHDHHEIDMLKVLADLKSNGPMTLIEVSENDGDSVKIWLE